MVQTDSQAVPQAAPSEAEYRAVREGAGLLDVSDRGKLSVEGPDAAAYLQGLVTNDVEVLEDGTGCYAVLLNVKGRMIADMRILRDRERFLLDLERAPLESVLKAANMYRIGYRVEIDDRTETLALLALIGPRAHEISGAPGPLREHDFARVTIAGVDCLAVAADHGAPGIDLIFPVQGRDRVRERLVEAGAAPVSVACAECLRVEAGIPRYGFELDEATFPQEAGVHERAVSYTKGCYVGQEPVARMFHRGHPNRLLRGLRLSAVVERGSELVAEGKAVGMLTSVTESPVLGPIGLAIVRREVEPGGELALAGTGQTAEVTELPFR